MEVDNDDEVVVEEPQPSTSKDHPLPQLTYSMESRGGKHIQDLFSDVRLAELRKRMALVDITLLAGPPDNQTSIKAHRVILALASGFFWDQFVEHKEPEMRVRGIDPLNLRTIVDYMYTGAAQLNDNNVEELYQAANMLDIASFMGKCEEYMSNNINDDNWGRRLTFARVQDLGDLTDLVLRYISGEKDEKTFGKYLASPQFLDLELEDVTAILDDHERTNTPEETVFSSIVNWLEHRKADRLKFAAKFLTDFLDLAELPGDFLQFHFEQKEVLRSVECLEYYSKFKQSKGILDESKDEPEKDAVYVFPHKSVSGSEGEGEGEASPKERAPRRQGSTRKAKEKAVKEAKKKSRRGRKGKKFGKSRRKASDSPKEKSPPSKKRRLEDDHKPEEESDEDEAEAEIYEKPDDDDDDDDDNSPSPPPPPPVKATTATIKPTARKKTGGSRADYKAIRNRTVPSITKSSKDADYASPRASSPLSVSTQPVAISRSARSTASLSSSTTSKISGAAAAAAAALYDKDRPLRVVYLREVNANAGDYRVMMTDLVQKYPTQLRPFQKCNRNPALIWVGGDFRKMYALGGVSTVLKEEGSSKEVRHTPESNLMRNSDREKFWLKSPVMSQARAYFSALFLNDCIYALGGSEGICGNEAINVVEKLCLNRNKDGKDVWVDTDYLQRARQGYGAGIIDGKIYVCGGYGAESEDDDCSMGIINSVERYDPKLDRWEYGPSMNECRHGLSVVALDSKLYAIGGGGIHTHTDFEQDFAVQKSVERYDPKEDCWSTVANMNRPRKDGSAVVMYGKIYAIGGDMSRGEGKPPKSSVEMYDPNEDKWKMVFEELDEKGVFTSVALMDVINPPPKS